MKKAILILVAFCVASMSFAQRTPDWVLNKPTPTNSTYLYVVESAYGNSEIQARNQAIARVFQSTAMRLGQPVNSEEINRAVQSGTSYDVISKKFNIPVNKVCEYTENKTGSYRVYILCQVAKAGNIPVQFDEFNDCYEGANKFYAAEALTAKGFDVSRNGFLLSENDVRSLFANSKSYDLYDMGINCRDLEIHGFLSGFGIAGVSVGPLFMFFGWLLDEDAEDLEWHNGCQTAIQAGKYMLIAGGCCLLASWGINAYGKAQIRKAVRLYNNGALYSQNAIEMQYGFSGNGIFLTLSF